MVNIPDAYDLWASNERKSYNSTKYRPLCSCCQEPISGDMAYRVNGELYCEDCIEDMKEYVEDEDDEW